LEIICREGQNIQGIEVVAPEEEEEDEEEEGRKEEEEDLRYAMLVFLLRVGAFGSQWNMCGARYNFLLPQHLKVYL
jgi:hypothetical protein